MHPHNTWPHRQELIALSEALDGRDWDGDGKPERALCLQVGAATHARCGLYLEGEQGR